MIQNQHRQHATKAPVDARVPFLIKAPGAGFIAGTTDALVELLDLFPTLCDLTGIPTPSQCEGTSLVTLLRDSEAEWTELAYTQYPRWGGVMGYSVKSHDGRFTEWLDEKTGAVKAHEYYDHRVDPNENKNESENPEFAEVISELSAAMRKERGG